MGSGCESGSAPPKLSLRPGPEDYFRHLAEYRAASYSIWHHTEPISTFIGSDLSRFDAIYRIEDLAELEEDLSRRTGKRISMPREQTAGRKVALDELSGAAREAVLAHTRADYDLLRDFYAPPG